MPFISSFMTFVSGKCSTLVWSHWMYVSFAAVTTGAVGHMVSSKSNVSTKSPPPLLSSSFSSPPPREVDAKAFTRVDAMSSSQRRMACGPLPVKKCPNGVVVVVVCFLVIIKVVVVVVVFRFAAATTTACCCWCWWWWRRSSTKATPRDMCIFGVFSVVVNN